MSIFDRIAKLWPRNSADSDVGTRVFTNQSESPEETGRPIQLRRFSRAELDLAIGKAWYAGAVSRKPAEVAKSEAVAAVDRYRRSEKRRRASESRAAKKSDPLQSSNVMESQK